MARELKAEELREVCSPERLGCDTTESLTPLESIIGQDRAIRALRFGLGIGGQGFNIYVAGPPGTGKTTAVKNFLAEVARARPVPDDWCYVNDFGEPYRPRVVRLPAGKGREFAADVRAVVEAARREIPRAFESTDYARKREDTVQSFAARREELLERLSDTARKGGFVIQSSPVGLFVIPLVQGRPLQEQEVADLPQEARDDIQRRRKKLEEEIRGTQRAIAELEKLAAEAIDKLNKKVALFVIGHLFSDLSDKYRDHPAVVSYLAQMREDVLANLDLFRGSTEAQARAAGVPPPSWARETAFRKYEVNVLVDNSGLEGAPVVVELNPTHNNLLGRIEKEAHFGALATDFTLVRRGSLHQANGGFLVIPAEDLLRDILAWEGLKRSIRNGEIVVEEAGERLGFIATRSLRPEPIPLDVKVVLVGPPLLHRMLLLFDPDFKELFKVKAEFDTEMARNEENVRRCAAFFCTLCQKEGLRHLDAHAMARLIEYSSRLAADKRKLSTRFAEIADVIREASYYAAEDGSTYVGAQHVHRALEEHEYRSNLVEERIREMFTRGIILLDTEGEAVAQVNGLSVVNMGDFSFGKSSRITASVGLGREGVVDIEREARLGGPIHTKGVLILAGYLSRKFARDVPLSLSARLVFEQTYEEIEGDSASSAELYALLSALSGLPVKQSLAVTGSVNQMGEIQAIGGVNEKIEGFYETCKVRGLTGKQGVVIPESNVQNLMLKEEVVEAVRQGLFHVYGVRTVDEGIELLTGVPAGALRPDGTYPQGTVNWAVAARFKELAERYRAFIVEREGGPV